MHATSQFSVARWNEKIYGDQLPDGKKLSQSDIVYELTGDMQGKAYIQSLMVYTHTDNVDPHKSEATYVSLWKFEGSLGGEEGGFVLTEQGTYAGGVARGLLRIVSGSGSGALKGIEGSGECTASAASSLVAIDWNGRVP